MLLFGPIGVFVRYFMNVLVINVMKIDNFWGTLVINLLGCFAIGLVRVFGVEKGHLSDALSISLMVGFIGGFTTFSGFALDTFLLFDQNQPLKTVFACLNGILQPVFGILIVFATVAIFRRIGD
jgi:CrcB protein